MSEREALYRTVIENPEDDAPRLVFADWLEEHGEPERAEFIRVQIELARFPASDPAALRLRSRAERLARGKKTLWRQDLPKLRGVQWGNFARGFISSARFKSQYWFRIHIRQVVSVAPIHMIHFNPSRDGASLKALSTSPHLARLIHLDLSGLALTDETITPLAKATHLQQLRDLNLTANILGPLGVRRLARSKAFPSLRTLSLARNRGIGPEGAAELIAAPWVRKLEILIIDREGLGSTAPQALQDAFGDRVVFPRYR